jgi:hypothetical protein
MQRDEDAVIATEAARHALKLRAYTEKIPSFLKKDEMKIHHVTVIVTSPPLELIEGIRESFFIGSDKGHHWQRRAESSGGMLAVRASKHIGLAEKLQKSGAAHEHASFVRPVVKASRHLWHQFTCGTPLGHTIAAYVRTLPTNG